ncbi:MAG TPA: hypothetical protein VFK86_04495, partial [Bauldia sp.]|nr:hypothetical protein [Bauldia sp.]
IALQAIGEAVENTPSQVVQLLGLAITGEKGSLPAPAEPAPPAEPGGMTPSIEPSTPPTDGGDGTQGMMPSSPPSDPGTGQAGSGSTPSAPAQRSAPNKPDELRETLNPGG